MEGIELRRVAHLGSLLYTKLLNNDGIWGEDTIQYFPPDGTEDALT